MFWSKKNLECPRARWDNWKSNDKPLADSGNKFGTCTLHVTTLAHNCDTVGIFIGYFNDPVI
jgi:cadmium resistance protein CadD (predicted permease)